jgi:glutamine cyclotransferase
MVTNLHRLVVISILCAILAACSNKHTPQESPPEEPTPQKPPVQQISYTVAQRYPHDSNAFTQGLEIYQGAFLESTGQYGSSSLRRVGIATGNVEKSTPLNARYFGEGITQLSGRIYMLTWLNQEGLVFDAKTLKQQGTFSYTGEGWGITNDGKHLYMSNGTSLVTVLDPTSWTVVRTIAVTLDGMAVSQLNELEWINGDLWANIWQSDKIVRISPSTGNVTGVIDLTGILPQNERTPYTDVLNGIAWDSTAKLMYVTGKNWPAMFALSLK